MAVQLLLQEKTVCSHYIREIPLPITTTDGDNKHDVVFIRHNTRIYFIFSLGDDIIWCTLDWH